MDRINYKVHLSYNDILLLPYDDEPCTIESRNDPDISTEICPGKKMRIPIIASPMDSVTGIEMIKAMAMNGCVGIHTRFINNPEELNMQISAIKEISEFFLYNSTIKCPHIAVAIGVRDNPAEKARQLYDAGADIICLDIANANHIFMLEAIEQVAKLQASRPNLSIIAGNVATPKAAIRLANAGANSCKIGLGPGASCTTRRVTGVGCPQLTAIMNCAPVLRERNVRVIADGGIRFSGDASKALWAGADAVMLGYVLAGHNECPSLGLNRIYRGMSCRTVSRRSDIAAEGVSFEVPNRGPVSNTIQEYAAAIRATCSMANAMTLQQMRTNVNAIRVSTMSQSESDPVKGE